MDFFQTIMGRKLIEGTLPEIASQLKVIADELKRQNDLKEKEIAACDSDKEGD
jgi:hypothetical protein